MKKVYFEIPEHYDRMDKKEFSDYLRSVGFNDNGIREILQRFEECREDWSDKYQLEQFNKKIED